MDGVRHGDMRMESENKHDWMTRLVETFLKGNFSILLILVSLVMGAAALVFTPREEDPQIVVPVADVFVNMPGASAREVERQVATRLEKLLYQIDGVEYVYSTSFEGRRHRDRAVLRRSEPRGQLGQAPQQDRRQHRPGPARGHGLGGQTRRNRRRSHCEPHALQRSLQRLRTAADGRGVGDPAPVRQEHRPHLRGRRPAAPGDSALCPPS